MPSGIYRRSGYDDERDLESAILEVQTQLFGPNRIYLDTKKLIGKKGEQQNIPDGYLLDLTGQKPRLFVVENELASHEPLRHVAAQILQFSLAFESAPLTVRSILSDALTRTDTVRDRCETYAHDRGYDSLFHMLDWLVHSHESPFTALVIIDEMSDVLERALTAKFRFGVEVLELARFENDRGERIYQFEPFLAEISLAPDTKQEATVRPAVPTDQLDTIVFGGTAQRVEQEFLGEHCWTGMRIASALWSQLRWIAVYEGKPISAIRYMAPVASIELSEDGNRVMVKLGGDPHDIGPIHWIRGGRVVYGIAAARYTNHERLEVAKTLDDVW